MGRNFGLELGLATEYNSNPGVSACDAKQFQANAMISIASREMEEKLKSILGSQPLSPSSPLPKSPASYLSNTNTGLSLKRSLQCFLEKRKSRIQSSAPYNLYSN